MQINIRYISLKFEYYTQTFALYSPNIKKVLENSYEKSETRYWVVKKTYILVANYTFLGLIMVISYICFL